MLLKDTSFVAIDFETTGHVAGFAEEAWQIGLAFVNQGKFNPEFAYSRYLYVSKDRPFNQYVPGRHASIRELLNDYLPLSAIWDDLSPWLANRPLLSHNVPVEKRILAHYFPMHDFGPWIDTLTMARETFPRAKSHKLGDLITALKLQDIVEKAVPGKNAHDAWYDAVACAVLFEYLVQLPRWRNQPLERKLF